MIRSRLIKMADENVDLVYGAVFLVTGGAALIGGMSPAGALCIVYVAILLVYIVARRYRMRYRNLAFWSVVSVCAFFLLSYHQG